MSALTVRASGLTVPVMSETDSVEPDERRSSAWQGLLLLAFAALFAWGAQSGARASESAEISQIEALFQAELAEVAPAEAPEQEELESLSEQLEDPLLALGQPELDWAPSVDGDAGEPGWVLAWVLCSPTFPSSSARGPPTC